MYKMPDAFSTNYLFLNHNINFMSRVYKNFFIRDVIELAPALLGMNLVVSTRNISSGIHTFTEYPITETEAYRGEEDLACHARKGRTQRTEMMYHAGGVLYVYLVYGIHWMLNIVTGPSEVPQAVLIRGVKGIEGPGRLTKSLGIDKSYNSEDLTTSSRIWLNHTNTPPRYKTTPRIGIDYAGPLWKEKPWRFVMEEDNIQFKAGKKRQ